MSQLAKDTKSEPDSVKKKWRVHKRTIAVVVCAVIFPWALIAIPGTLDTGDDVAGWNIYHLLHGWPFVHLESTHYQAVGNSEEGRYRLSRLPQGMDNIGDASEAATLFTEGRSPVQLNLRLEKERYRPHWLGKLGFWSDVESWPTLRTGVHFTPRYFGMLLNLLCMALVVFIVAALCERRIRRHGRLLKYSLANLLIGIALIAVACAWIAQIRSDRADQSRLDDPLQTLSDKRFSDNNELYYFSKSHESRFPLVISQLLNHGKHPWGAVPYFRQVKSGHILVRIRKESDLDRLKRIKSLVCATKYSVDLDLSNLTAETQEMLNALDGVNLVSLTLSFGDRPAVRNWLHNGQEADLARALASRQRNSLFIEELSDRLKNMDLKVANRLRGITPTLAGQKLAGQKLIEQKKEPQSRKDETRPYIGIFMGAPEDEGGIRITGIVDKSPADLANLQFDDVILKIDDEVVISPGNVIKQLRQYEVNDRVTLTVRRGGKEMKIKLTLTEGGMLGPDNKLKNWTKMLSKVIAAEKIVGSGFEEDADIDKSLRELLGGKNMPGDQGALLSLLTKQREMKRKLERAGFKVDIDIDMSKLESLSLRLDHTLSQKEQLQPFVGLPSLKSARITGLSIEGAEFILATKEQWPEEMVLEFRDDIYK